MIRLSFLTLCAALALAGRAQAESKTDFAIKLHRPDTVGTRGRVVIDGRQSQKFIVLVGGEEKPASAADAHVRLESTVTTLSVDAKGNTVAETHTIDRFEVIDPEGNQPLLHKGQVLKLVRAKKAEDAELTVDGEPADESVRKAAAVVLTLSAAGGATDDDIFGTTARQPVGASWPVNSKVAEEDFASSIGVRSTISGKTTLTRQLVVDGTDCVELSGNLDAVIKSMTGLPPGTVFKKASMHAHMGGAFPVNPTLPRLTDTMDMTMTAVLLLPQQQKQPPMEGHLTVTESRTRTFAPLPAVAGQ